MFAVARNFERQHWKIFTDIFEALAHESLDGKNRVLRVGNEFGFCSVAHKNFAVLIKMNNGWDEFAAVASRQNTSLSVFNDGDQAVRCAEVDSNDLGH